MVCRRRLWTCKYRSRLKALPHTSHSCGRPSVCSWACSVRWCLKQKEKLKHDYFSSSECSHLPPEMHLLLQKRLPANITPKRTLPVGQALVLLPLGRGVKLPVAEFTRKPRHTPMLGQVIPERGPIAETVPTVLTPIVAYVPVYLQMLPQAGRQRKAFVALLAGEAFRCAAVHRHVLADLRHQLAAHGASFLWAAGGFWCRVCFCCCLFGFQCGTFHLLCGNIFNCIRGRF